LFKKDETQDSYLAGDFCRRKRKAFPLEPNLSTVRLRLSVVLRETWASDEQFIFME